MGNYELRVTATKLVTTFRNSSRGTDGSETKLALGFLRQLHAFCIGMAIHQIRRWKQLSKFCAKQLIWQ